MPEHTALGFDPAPGNPAAVLALTKKLAASAASSARPPAWSTPSSRRARPGRARPPPPSAPPCRTTSRATWARRTPPWRRPRGRLTSWHDTLVAHRALAARYATLAAAAKTEESLSDTRRLARELAEEHRSAARRVADTLNATAARLAPKEPGVLASIWHKITDDPGDALSNASAVLGAIGAGVALLCPPHGPRRDAGRGRPVPGGPHHARRGPQVPQIPVRRLHQGRVRRGLLEERRNPARRHRRLRSRASQRSPQEPRPATTAARAAMAAAPESSALAGLGAGTGAFGRTTWSTGLAIQEVENPLLTWAVRTTDPTVRKSVGLAAPVAGAVTGGAGFLSDSESVEQASTTADGVRGILDDAPSAAAKSASAWSVMRP